MCQNCEIKKCLYNNYGIVENYINVTFALASTLNHFDPCGRERCHLFLSITNLFTQVDLILPGPCTLNIPPGAIAAANKEVGSQDLERVCR